MAEKEALAKPQRPQRSFFGGIRGRRGIYIIMYTLYIGYGWGDKTVNGDYMCGTYPLAGAALVAVRSVDRPNLCIYF